MHPTVHTPPAGIRNVAIRRMALWGTFLAIIIAGVVADAITLTAVQSRKTHGAVTHDLTIDKSQSIGGAVTVESGAIGSGHQIVFQFDTAVTSIGVPSAFDEIGAPVSISTLVPPVISGNDVVITLTGVPDNKRVTVVLPSVNASDIAEVKTRVDLITPQRRVTDASESLNRKVRVSGFALRSRLSG